MSQSHADDSNISLTKFFQLVSKLPSPDKLLHELQRLNDNMERLQPDLSKMANLNLSDIRNLASAIQGIDIPKMMLSLNEATSIMKGLYTKLWGPK